MGARDGDEIKMDVRMMAAPCDEVGRGGVVGEEAVARGYDPDII